MADVKISELTSAASLDGTEIVPIVQSGSTVKTTAQDIADLGGGSGFTIVTGTLTAGSTSLVLQDASITTSSLILYGSEVMGVYPTNMVASTGSLTLTFEAQQASIGIAVIVIGGAS